MPKNVIISRKGAADYISAKGVANHMKYETMAIRTGDEYPDDCENVFRWGCTANSPRGTKKFNKAESIHLVFNKGRFRKLVCEAIPDAVPFSLFPDSPVKHFLNLETFPLVIRPSKHERGNDFIVCNNKEELGEKLDEMGVDWYISKFYNKKKEYRVFAVQGRAAFVVEKNPPDRNAPAWGLGGRWNNIKWGDWPINIVKPALQVFNLSGLDFGAVDIILDDQDNSYVTEINTAAELSGPYEQSKVAECFDYILQGGPITPFVDESGWKGYIHPALTNKAV